jgi:hypothetical protein
MPKLPLSPFLLDPDAPLPGSDPRSAGCPGHGAPSGRPGAMELGAAELFVVATLRAWVAPLMRPGEPHPDWRELFRLAGVGAPAAIAFDGLMSVIGAHAQRLIEVHCCRCPTLGEDETAMLRLMAALQADRPGAALHVLGDWLPGAAVGPALQAARRFAIGIAEAGLALPRRGEVTPFPPNLTLH